MIYMFKTHTFKVYRLPSSGKCTQRCSYRHTQDMEHFISLVSSLLALCSQISPTPALGRKWSDYHYCPLVSSVLDSHISGFRYNGLCPAFTQHNICGIYPNSCGICPFAVSVVFPLLLLCSIPLNRYAPIGMLIHLMLNMWVISREGLLWMKLL